MPLELKSTINLPKTDFPMKANLPQNEPKALARWQEMGIYQRIREARQGAPSYVLHDGPPYANGPIHLGHALNKCLKDFIVKSKTMSGFDSPYVPGWDCHGLPIEIKVDQQLGGKKLQMEKLEVREACRKYAQKFLDLQREQFKRIGVFGRWDNPYSTMTPQYESVVLATFYDFLEKDFVYKGLRSVYWCIFDKTALAEAEVEYENHTSPTVWVKYALADDPAKIDAALAGKKVFTVIWTTTPWTLPASMAVAFHPDAEYVAVESGRRGLHRRRSTGRRVRRQGRAEGNESRRSLPRQETRVHEVCSPLPRPHRARRTRRLRHHGPGHRRGPHCAFARCRRLQHRREVQARPDHERGRRRHHPQRPARIRRLESFRRQRAHPRAAEKTRRADAFGKSGALVPALLALSQPHHLPRHRAVVHLDGNADGQAATLRSRTLDEIKKVKWDPAWGEERISNMIATRPDWCISRQRIWGVPIAVFLCEGCGKPLNEPALNRKVIELFARGGADAWYTPQADALIPAGTKCAKCGDEKFSKETDILDVWFESGCSHAAVLGHEPGLPWPADLYLEGGDQHRGWFHSSLLCAVGTRNQAPYRGVATNGWTLDEQGRALSKSRGNDVDPVDIANRLGGEIVRLWVASVDFREDVVGSEQLMQRVADSYRKIRNSLFRYVLSNLYDFDPHEECGDVRPVGHSRSVHAAPDRRNDRRRHSLVRRVCISQNLSPHQRLLRSGAECVLLRCPERPLVHLCAQFPEAPRGADGHLAHR